MPSSPRKARRARADKAVNHKPGGSDPSAMVDLDPPLVRPLKAYAFDPSQGRLLGNEMSVRVRYQELAAGPVPRRRDGRNAVAVLDYDGAARKWYRPVDLDDSRILIRGGLDPTESDPRFHQQMVYAVATETIQHFEAALGRQIHWRRAERDGDFRGWLPGDVLTLGLFPHGMLGPNAFYSPDAHGILFGYFRADARNPGPNNLPGQMVYTCLSHDVVAHEMTHAIVDGIRSHFTEATNPDVAAFHEAFADLVALFRHFTHREVLLDTVERTGGMLYRYQLRPETSPSPDDFFQGPPGDPGKAAPPPGGAAEAPPALAVEERVRNPLVELAQQFGEARGMNRGLRSALGSAPEPARLRRELEPHARGSILVAAVFDAYFSIYVRRTADLFRIYRAGGGDPDAVGLPSALASRLADEAVRTADIFFTICVRALDYCPPVDITFGDFLRAVITADLDLHPVDPLGIRDALMQGFRRRGIVPASARFFSEGAIAWPRASWMALPPVKGLEFGDPNGLTREEQGRNARALSRYFGEPWILKRLGLDPAGHMRIASFHPVFRVNPDGSLRSDMVVELVQRRDAPFDEDTPEFGSFPLRGGAAVILSRPTPAERRRDPKAGAPVRYVIGKQLRGPEGEAREARQRAYCLRLGLAEGRDPARFRIDFALVHGGF